MTRFFDALASFQYRRPLVILAGALAISLGALPLIANLGLDSRFIALLPDDKLSVQDLHKVKDRVRGLSSMSIAVESPSKNIEAMRRFAQDLAERLQTYPPAKVGKIDWNVRAYDQFVRDNRHQFAPIDLLERLRDALEERVDKEKLKANPFYVDLEEEGEFESESVEDVLEELEEKGQSAEGKAEKFPDGFYQHPDGDLIAIFSRSDVGGDKLSTNDLLAIVEKEVAALDPKKYAKDLTVTCAGDVIMARQEQQAIAQELVIATVLTVSIVMALIVVFFGRFRAVPLLAAGLVPPVLLSFAIAELTVDSLNTSTAFLGSIIIGNGVNPNIIWLSRYFEERRAGRATREALFNAHQGAWLATMIASGAAALAYGSLMITAFRGFRDFGIIGGAGMVLCWLSAMLVLPAAVALYERWRPLAQDGVKRGGRFADLFATVAARAPRAVLFASLLVTGVAVFAVAQAALNDPIEYDFRKLRSIRDDDATKERAVHNRINKMVSGEDQGRGIAVLVDDRADVASVQAQLSGSEGVLHGGTRTLDDFLPKDAELKREVLEEIRELLVELRPHVDEETQTKIDDNMPPEDLPALSLRDLPDQIAHRFTERDGTRGRIVIVRKTKTRSTWDGRYLTEWAGALRELKLSDGSRPPLAGRATVFADVVAAVYEDMPKAIGAAFVATLILVLMAFSNKLDSVLCIMALLIGIVWMAGAMALLGMKLNFLNFVAFPITFGNGVDYSINVMRRYRLEQRAGTADPIKSAVTLSGGAVVLCSLTTIVGYSSLYVSANLAMNSFGLAMAISEVTCLLGAVLTMPSLMILLRRRGILK